MIRRLWSKLVSIRFGPCWSVWKHVDALFDKIRSWQRRRRDDRLRYQSRRYFTKILVSVNKYIVLSQAKAGVDVRHTAFRRRLVCMRWMHADATLNDETLGLKQQK